MPYKVAIQLQVIDDAIEGLQHLRARCLREESDIADIVDSIVNFGCVSTVGAGKSGTAAKKAASMFNTTGTPAVFVNPSDALHGDVCCLQGPLLAFSLSGTTNEVVKVASFYMGERRPIVAITSKADSSLAVIADHVIEIGEYNHVPPTASIHVMQAVGDMLALLVAKEQGRTESFFKRMHPG